MIQSSGSPSKESKPYTSRGATFFAMRLVELPVHTPNSQSIPSGSGTAFKVDSSTADQTVACSRTLYCASAHSPKAGSSRSRILRKASCLRSSKQASTNARVAVRSFDITSLLVAKRPSG